MKFDDLTDAQKQRIDDQFVDMNVHDMLAEMMDAAETRAIDLPIACIKFTCRWAGKLREYRNNRTAAYTTGNAGTFGGES